MVNDIVVVGAGGFGRETLDVIEAVNAQADEPAWRVLGIVDDKPTDIQLERVQARGYEYIGSTERALERMTSATFTVGIGSPEVRMRIANLFEDAGWQPSILLHPAAVIGSESIIKAGSVVCGGVQLSTNTRLGRYVHLNPGSIVGHDSVLGDFVSINPGGIVSGDVEICDRTLVGAGAVILQGLKVGADSVVGANACVTKSIPAEVTVKGVPAR